MVPNPSPISMPVPIVPWEPIRKEPVPAASRFRLAGAIVGCFVALAAITISLFTGSGSVALDPSASSDASWGAAAILAGALGGWTLGPEAWRARSFFGWAALVVRLGILAVGLGALTVGLAIGVVVSLSIQPPVLGAAAAIVFGVLFALIGVLAFGVFALPVTLAAAFVWAIAMRLLRTRVATMPPTSRTSRVATVEPPQSGAVP